MTKGEEEEEEWILLGFLRDLFLSSLSSSLSSLSSLSFFSFFLLFSFFPQSFLAIQFNRMKFQFIPFDIVLLIIKDNIYIEER